MLNLTHRRHRQEVTARSLLDILKACFLSMFFAQVDPLVSLMMVEKVPDSTYEMVGGLDKQIKEIKEVIELPVKHPELFEALGIAQPKVSYVHHVTHSVGAEE